jgi:Flp pilus assembly protein TadB
MSDAMMGLAGVVVGSLIVLVSNFLAVRQHRKEAAENVSQKIMDRRLKLAYDAAKIDQNARIEAARINRHPTVIPFLASGVAYHLTLISRLEKTLGRWHVHCRCRKRSG